MEITYDKLRNISPPGSEARGIEVYCGYMLARELLKLDTSKNVRDDLVDAEGKKHKSLSDVHRAMRSSMDENPEEFPYLSGGVTIVAGEVEVFDKRKTVELLDASIIDGAQTKGEFKRYYERVAEGQEDNPIYVKFELIVTTDESLVAAISIARNFQNDVKPLSIINALRHLEGLKTAMAEDHPGFAMRAKESEFSDELLDTEKLIQVLAAMTPVELRASEDDYVYAYSGKARCLKAFSKCYLAAKSFEDGELKDSVEARRYRFWLSICGEAWRLYKELKVHPAWPQTRLKCFERTKGTREFVEAPDGLIFPILVSVSIFWNHGSGARKAGREHWGLNVPASFGMADFIKSQVSQTYRQIAKSKPHLMGRDRNCYMMLMEITKLHAKLAGQVASAPSIEVELVDPPKGKQQCRRCAERGETKFITKGSQRIDHLTGHLTSIPPGHGMTMAQAQKVIRDDDF